MEGTIRCTIRPNATGLGAADSIHFIMEPLIFPVGSMTAPCSSTAWVMSIEARIDVTVNQTDFMAKKRPGQMRLPKPNAPTIVGSIISRLSLPSFKKRSGLKTSGLGYTRSSFKIALRTRLTSEKISWKDTNLYTRCLEE